VTQDGKAILKIYSSSSLSKVVTRSLLKEGDLEVKLRSYREELDNSPVSFEISERDEEQSTMVLELFFWDKMPRVSSGDVRRGDF
jgi:hypothetical protein